MTWLGRVFRRQQLENELDKEICFHVDEHERALIARGVSPGEAHRQARLALGGADQIKEDCRDARGTRWLEDVTADVRYGLRQLRANPGFAAITIIILALGIGATAAIFSVVYPILFEPLPYPNAKRLMMVWEAREAAASTEADLRRIPSFGTFRGIAERTQSFEAMAALKAWQPAMTSADKPERLEGQRVSASYFSVLGVKPEVGRDFQASDDVTRGPNVVVLSHALWQRRFSSDRNIVGQQVKLDGDLYSVIAVMPAKFENVLSPDAQLWAPLQYNIALPPNGREWGHHLRVVGRLRPGVTRTQAASELGVIFPTFAKEHAAGFDSAGGPAVGFVVSSLQSDMTREVKPALLAVLGAVLLLLVIACVNVTNLLLARGAQRRGEFAVRSALGAARSRLVRQLITESVLAAIIGGVAGIVVAEFGIRTLIALSPPGLPRMSEIRLNAVVFAFAFGVTTVAGVIVGMAPALHAARSNIHETMQAISRRTAGGHEWTRRALVAAEVSIAVVLLISAGLLVRTLRHVFSTQTGFDASHVITMQVQESGHAYDKDPDRLRFFRESLERVRALPGVISSGFVNQLPLSGDYEVYGAVFRSDPNGAIAAFRYAVTPGYFETMRIPLQEGRLFTERDDTDAPKVVLLSESFAKRKFPHGNAIGQQIHAGPYMNQPDQPWGTVVGVVGDVKHGSLEATDNEAFYTPNSQWAWADQQMTLVARTKGDPAALASSIRAAMWSVDKDQPIVRVATMEKIVTASEAQRRFAMFIFETFALMALALATAGIYGVLAGAVTERMREIGVRAALGASRSDIVGLVFRQGMTVAIAGLLIGIAAALAATRAVATMLFGISRLDPITYAGVVAVLLAASAVACSLPAWRAASVDPSITLRAE